MRESPGACKLRRSCAHAEWTAQPTCCACAELLPGQGGLRATRRGPVRSAPQLPTSPCFIAGRRCGEWLAMLVGQAPPRRCAPARAGSSASSMPTQRDQGRRRRVNAQQTLTHPSEFDYLRNGSAASSLPTNATAKRSTAPPDDQRLHRRISAGWHYAASASFGAGPGTGPGSLSRYSAPPWRPARDASGSGTRIPRRCGPPVACYA